MFKIFGTKKFKKIFRKKTLKFFLVVLKKPEIIVLKYELKTLIDIGFGVWSECHPRPRPDL
jgi:hypothetical protein